VQLDRRAFLGGAGVLGLSAALEPLARAAPALPFPELRAAGTHGAIGLQHGRTFQQAIKHNAAFYLAWLGRATGAKSSDLLQLARAFTPVLEREVPELYEEIEGIARGSRRSPEEILLINARTDLLVVAGRLRPPRQPKPAPGCTALVMVGKGRGDKPLLALGQNWDWRPELKQHTVVLRLQPSKGPRIVTFTEAGMVGKIGFNEHRLGVCLNFLAHKSDSPHGELGVPVHCLLRACMGCATLERAYKLVAWASRCASANFMLAQHAPGTSPAALDLEITPTAVARIPLRDGFLVHTNHFKDTALSPGCTSGRGRSTMNRNEVAEKLARRLGPQMLDPSRQMTRVLASREGAPYSVSKTSAPDSPSMTLAGIVMDLSRNRLLLTAGGPHQHRWVVRPGV